MWHVSKHLIQFIFAIFSLYMHKFMSVAICLHADAHCFSLCLNLAAILLVL